MRDIGLWSLICQFILPKRKKKLIFANLCYHKNVQCQLSEFQKEKRTQFCSQFDIIQNGVIDFPNCLLIT